MKNINILAACLVGAVSAQAFEVENVTARQRWPWNNLVDVDYEITGAAAGEAFAIDVKAEWAGGSKKAVATSFVTEPIGACGVNRITWNFGEDCPNVVAEDLRVSVTATPFSEKAAVYMVVDISSGKDSTKYPVRYTTTPPDHVRGAGNEPCQTTEIWLRRIPAKGRTYFVNSYGSAARVYAQQTKDYYLGIFEVTQRQWKNVAGTLQSYNSYYVNPAYSDSRPVDRVSQVTALGAWNWPTLKEPTADSFFGRLRARTGIGTFNLPTDGQFQFAVSAGPMTEEKSSYGDAIAVSRCLQNCTAPSDNATCGIDQATAYVGTYLPNNFGLYDMLGNVWESVLDPYVTVAKFRNYYSVLGRGMSADDPLLDPEGLPTDQALDPGDGTARAHTMQMYRGGCWNSQSPAFWDRTYAGYSENMSSAGFRVAVTCEK